MPLQWDITNTELAKDLENGECDASENEICLIAMAIKDSPLTEKHLPKLQRWLKEDQERWDRLGERLMFLAEKMIGATFTRSR